MKKNEKQEKTVPTGSAFESAEDEAVVSLLKTVDFIHRNSSETMEPFGVTSQQYNILRILRGVYPDGLPTLELAGRMLVRSPGVTRLIDRLEKKEFVIRKRSEQDRRVVECKITPNGLKLLKKMDHPVAKMNRRIVKNLNETQIRTLVELLNRMRQ